MGIVTIEDFDGVGELAMFADEWSKWVGKFRVGCTVFVKMKSQERYRNSNNYFLNVISVDFLNEVAEDIVKSITVTIDIDAEVEENGMLEDFASIIKNSSGETKLSLVVRDARISTDSIKLSADVPGIKMNRKLMDFIQAHENMHISI